MQPDLLQTQQGAEIELGQTYRPNILPFTRDAQTGQWQLAIPRILDLLGNGLPGMEGAAIPAGMRAAEGALDGSQEARMLASRSERIYNPPDAKPRPFEADYPPER